MNKLIKPYFKQFILKTHPDYFHNDLSKKQTNATSLQKLSNILQNNSKSNTTHKLDFFIKGHKNLKKTGIFDSKDSAWFKIDSFFQLCKQLDIPVLQSDLDIVQDHKQKELNKHKKQFKTLSQEFAEKLYQQQMNQDRMYTLEDILKNNIIMFDPSLNDRLTIASKLCQWLPDLEPEKWWGKIPLLILAADTPSPPKQTTKGVLIIHNNMDLKDIQEYLKNNL